VVALLWNLLGCAAIAMDLMLTADDVLKMPAEQQAMYDARPGWAVAGSILAVLGGALGSLGLVLRRRWAGPLLLASLAGVLVQDAGFVMISQVAPLPPAVIGMQVFVLAIAIGLVWLARKAAANGWLR
jgi:hypothetical protein